MIFFFFHWYHYILLWDCKIVFLHDSFFVYHVMTLSMYFVEISVNISADVFVEKTYGKLVNQTLIFTSLPFIKLIVFTVTAQVHHKVISVDLVEFDII